MSAGHETFAVRQEDDTIGSRTLLRVALLSVGVALLGVFFAGLVLETNTGGIREKQAGRAPPAASRTIARVEQTPILGAADGLDLRARQREELSRYRWVDRDAGLASIPIERAMDIVAGGSR